MGNRFEGKVAVVTGGGGGIGRAVALLLAQEGASVVVNDLGCEVDGTGSSPDPAYRVAEEIKMSGGKAVASYEDVALMKGGEKVVQRAVDAFGRLDVLVNSTGVLLYRRIEEMTPQDFHQVIRNNVKGAFTPTRFAAVLFRQQRSGRIVNMTSDAGLGAVGRSNYAAASEAIVGLTRTVARDLGRYGVTCNAISPTAETRLFSDAGAGPSAAMGEWEGPGSPDDPGNVAPLAVYLCTDASPNINGNVFGVQGGSILLYSNPSVEKSIHKWGRFTLDEMDALAPKMFGSGF